MYFLPSVLLFDISIKVLSNLTTIYYHSLNENLGFLFHTNRAGFRKSDHWKTKESEVSFALWESHCISHRHKLGSQHSHAWWAQISLRVYTLSYFKHKSFLITTLVLIFSEFLLLRWKLLPFGRWGQEWQHLGDLSVSLGTLQITIFLLCKVFYNSKMASSHLCI